MLGMLILSKNSKGRSNFVNFGGEWWDMIKPQFSACNSSYLRNGARQSVGYNGPRIENHTLWAEWSRDLWRHVTPKIKNMTPNAWGLISRKPCQIQGWCQWPNHTLWVLWSRDGWRHVTLNGHGHNQLTFKAQYLGNLARYRVGYN